MCGYTIYDDDVAVGWLSCPVDRHYTLENYSFKLQAVMRCSSRGIGE